MRWFPAVFLVAAACDPDDDGFRGPADCGRRDGAVFPGAPETCDGVDQDCDGAVDDLDPDSLEGASYWLDLDGDGFGAFGTEVRACGPAPLLVPAGGDCADDDPERHPGVDEVCDRVDQDCDGQIDDDPTTPLYADLDGDGFGDPSAPTPNCDAWATSDASDCDDGEPASHPGAEELCNGADDDCDGDVDQADADVVPTVWYGDGDGDGFGDETRGVGCEPPSPTDVAVDGDCDDLDPATFPGAPERCDGLDNDCDAVPEGPDVWVFDGLDVRIPLAVTAPSAPGPLIVDVDFRAQLDALGVADLFDPSTLRAAVMDCGGPLGVAELPVQWLDGSAGLTVAGADDDPVGDEHGAVVVAWDLDGDPSTAEALPSTPVSVGLYLHGTAAPSPWVTDLVAEDQRLVTGGLEATFSPSQGGLLASLILDGSPSLADQAGAINGNGLLSTEGPLSAQDVGGTVGILDSGPVTAAVRAAGHVENDDGGFDFTATYRVFTGRPELWVTPSFEATDLLTIEGDPDRTVTLRPFQSRWSLVEPTCTSDAGLRWSDASDASWGLTWAWLAPPVYVTHLACDEEETWTAANDYRPCCFGTEGGMPAGTAWADHPVLVLLPHAGGPDAVAGARAARLAGVTVTAGPAELR